MKRLLLDPLEPDAAIVREAAAIVARGGIVAYPTDTLYGLAVDPRNDAAVDALFAAKGREPGAAVPLIAADEAQARQAGSFGPAECRAGRRILAGAADDRRAGSAVDVARSCRAAGQRSACACRRTAWRATSPPRSAAVSPRRARTDRGSRRQPPPTTLRPRSATGSTCCSTPVPCAGGPPSTIVEIVGGRPAPPARRRDAVGPRARIARVTRSLSSRSGPPESRERAALVGLFSGASRHFDPEHSLDELAGLAAAAGADVVLRVLQERPRPDPATFLGSGKVDARSPPPATSGAWTPSSSTTS